MKPRHLQQLRRYPRHAIWEITRACNLRCIHCEGSAGARGQDELTTDEALALCDALISMGCEQCNISGGEPLLRKDWPMLCKRLSHGGVRVTIVTNGTFLDDSAIDQAERAGVRGVAMSLDGLRDTHGRIRPQPKGSSFDDVAAALRRVRASCMAPAIITHINRWNFAELEGIHALLGIWGVDHWQLQLGLPLGRQLEIDQPYMISREQLRALGPRLTALIQSGASPRLRITDTIGYFDRCEPVLRRSSSGKSGFYTGCYAGMLTVGIESNGDVKGCSSMPAEFIAGNVRETPFNEIWADEYRFAYNTHWDDAKLTGFCATCSYRRLCRAGCTTLAWSLTGTIYENPYCLHRIASLRGEDAP